MKQRYSAYLMIILGLLVIVPGCKRTPGYKARLLPSIIINSVYEQDKDNIRIQVKRLSKAEQNYFFGERSQLLFDRFSNNQIIPLYLSITNESQQDCTVFPHNINLKLISYDRVFCAIKNKNGLFFADEVVDPLYVGGAIVATSYMIGGVSVCVSLGFLPVCFLIPFVCVTSIPTFFVAKLAKYGLLNRRIKRDLRDKTLHKKVVVKAGEEYAGLVFVREEDYHTHFTVAIDSSVVRNQMTFDIDLNKNQYAV